MGTDKTKVLVTGISGEIGHSLAHRFIDNDGLSVVGIDIREPSEKEILEKIEFHQGDICDLNFMNTLWDSYEFEYIFHMAAILSSRGEQIPFQTHHINVEATLRLLEHSHRQFERTKKVTKFIFPSTIGAYGVDRATETVPETGATEDQFLNPTTMYGINKLYVEKLGEYFNRTHPESIDFRAVRFPGIISADSIPSGGTSDYAPEMIHAAVKNEPYNCFVSPASRIPFIVMPDAVKVLRLLANAKRENLKLPVYNVSSFAPSAAEIEAKIKEYLDNVNVTYEPNKRRLEIIESWPERMDDSAARRDWDWCPDYDFDRAFSEYLIPKIKAYYNKD